MNAETFTLPRSTTDLASMNPGRLREMAAFLSGLADVAETRGRNRCEIDVAATERNAAGFEEATLDGQVIERSWPPLPDARLIREILRQRQLRARFFDETLFADPAWDMLLDLTAAHVDDQRVSISSLCIASQVPQTTALRWIRLMIDAGLLERSDDHKDRRRSFLTLTDKAMDAVARYFTMLNVRSGTVI